MFGLNKAPKKLKVPELEQKQDRILWTAIGTGVLAYFAYLGSAFFATFLLGVLAVFLLYKGATMKTTVEAKGQQTIYR